MFDSPVTPLLTLSEAMRPLNETPDTDEPETARNVNLRRIIAEDTALVQQMCGRRFDEYKATATFTARPYGRGGHLDGRELIVTSAGDLKSLTAITNGDGVAIDLSEVILLPGNYPIKYRIAIKAQSAAYWWAGANDPRNAISVSGVWGYGGYWKSLRATLNGALNNALEDIPVSDITKFERGMLIKVDSEYMLIEDLDTTGATIGVTRAYNGTDAAAHLTGATVSRFYANEVAAGALKRLWQWRVEQAKSPMFAQGSNGNATFALRVDRLPADVIAALQDGGLMRAPEIRSA